MRLVDADASESIDPSPLSGATESRSQIDVEVDAQTTLIQPTAGWQLVDFRELHRYRDLLWFLTWRSIKVRYAQSAIGLGWAILQPAFQIAIFTLVFGQLARINTDGIPHVAFYLATVAAWSYFSNAIMAATDSLVSNSSMLGKIYFPRVILPLSATLAALFDFAIAFFLSFLVLLVLGFVPGPAILMVPLLILMMAGSVLGISLWTSALAIQYRDVRYAMSFFIQLLMYASPVIYPASSIPAEWSLGGVKFYPQWMAALNPMFGILEGFRSVLLDSRSFPVGWIVQGAVVTFVLLVSGFYYFRAREKVFADVA